jgi:ClpP class serine protease
VWAHANELMCSAAFAIGSSAERIWVARTAEVGSIGVLGAHVDRSGADEMAGVKWTYIFAGDHKTDGNPHESLGEGPRARMQADVDNLMDMFVELASQNRGMTEDEIRATNADIYRGRLAVESGLADEVGTLDEALEAFAAHVDEMQTDEDEVRLSASQTRAKLMGVERGNTKSKVKAEVPDEDEDKKSKASATEEDDKKAETTDEDESKAKAEAEEEEEEAKKASASTSAVKAESDRCAGLVALAEQASRLGVSFNSQDAIKKGLSVDAARKTVMDAAAEVEEGEVSALAAPKHRADKGAGNKKVMSAEDKRSAWAKGFKRR